MYIIEKKTDERGKKREQFAEKEEKFDVWCHERDIKGVGSWLRIKKKEREKINMGKEEKRVREREREINKREQEHK